MQLPGLARAGHRLRVGVGQGQDLPGAPVLHDDRDEAALVVGDVHSPLIVPSPDDEADRAPRRDHGARGAGVRARGLLGRRALREHRSAGRHPERGYGPALHLRRPGAQRPARPRRPQLRQRLGLRLDRAGRPDAARQPRHRWSPSAARDGNDALSVDELSATVRLRGQRGNDDFALGDNVFTPVVVDGGSGTDTLDYGVAHHTGLLGAGARQRLRRGPQRRPGRAGHCVDRRRRRVAVLAPSGQLSVGHGRRPGWARWPTAPTSTARRRRARPARWSSTSSRRRPPPSTVMAGPFSPSAAPVRRSAQRAHVRGRCTPTGRRRARCAASSPRPASTASSTGAARVTQMENVEGSLTRRHPGRRRRAQHAARRPRRRHPDAAAAAPTHRRRHRRRHDLRRRGRRRHPRARRRGRPDRVRRRHRQRRCRPRRTWSPPTASARDRASARPPAPVADRRAAVAQHLPRGQAAHRAQGPGRSARRRQHGGQAGRRPPRSAPCCAIASRRRPR